MPAAAARALAVLNALADSGGGLTLAQLGQVTGIGRSSLLRLVDSLVEEGAVLPCQDSARYRASLRVLEPAVQLLGQGRVRGVAFPYMVELARATHHQVNLSLPELPDAIGVESVLVVNGMVTSQQVFSPLHCLANASGRAIAAFSNEADIDRALAIPLERTTPFTRVDRDDLRAELDAIRAKGYATIDREQQPDLSGLAVPLLDATGVAVGALGVSRRLPLDQEFIDATLEPALYASSRISAELGFRSRSGFSVA